MTTISAVDSSPQRRGQRTATWLLSHLWIFLPLLALPALWPFVTVGLLRSSDGRTHLLRLAALDRSIEDGILLPRWTPEMQLGHGYPVFTFYAPASYYLAEAFHLLGASYYWSYIGVLASAVLIGGFGMYCLARDLFGSQQRWPPLLAAGAYLYAPYLLLNVYIRGSLAGALVQALIPWIFWSFRRLWYTQQPLPWMLAAAGSLAMLALTHSISLLFAAPILVCYLLVLWAQRRGSPHAVRWAVTAILVAMGMSAFFWAPMLVERDELSHAAYATARDGWLPGNVWDWFNFLDFHLLFHYSFARPVPLGLVQVLLGVAGFLLARRRDAEWLFLGALALVTSLLIGRWALPLWTSNDILTVVQFPWRLLSIVSLPLALFVGGIVLRLRTGWPQAVVSILVVAGVIVAQTPHTAGLSTFSEKSMNLTVPVLAQSELEKGVQDEHDVASSVQEFRPRWASDTLLLQPAAVTAALPAQLVLTSASPLDLILSSTSSLSTTLRFADFYYPGWTVTVDGSAQRTYPSTNLGLLTVDVPAGVHTVHKRWAGTFDAGWAGSVSLATFVVLALVLGRNRRWRWLSIVPAALAIVGVAALFWPPNLRTVEAPRQAVAAHGVELAGFWVEETPSDPVIYPYWVVHSEPPADLRMRWQILDATGRVAGESITKPYFNALSADNWPVGTIIDDAAQLPAPAGLAAGRYQVAVGLGTTAEELAAPPAVIGEFTLAAATPADFTPQVAAAAGFGDHITLRGYDIETGHTTTNGRTAEKMLNVATAGQPVDITLYWQTTGPIDENYHGFVHLVDASGRPLVQTDQLPGPELAPPATWLPGRLYADTYQVNVPADAPSGLYWPQSGLYSPEDGLRLPVIDEGSPSDLDAARLLPIKIVGQPAATPAHATDARFADNIRLLGYDLDPAHEELRRGDPLTVTLYYRSEGAIDADLTRFLQLVDPVNGMAAQVDSPPQDGLNPTWSWQPGEIVRDQVGLRVSDTALPGRYQLLTGFYDAAAGAVRAPAVDGTGKALPDDAVALVEVTISP